MSNVRIKSLFFVIVFVVMISEANAQSADILDGILSAFQTKAASWEAVFKKNAEWLFVTLAVISMVHTFIFTLLNKSDIQDFYRELIRFILMFGFFLWCLEQGPRFAIALFKSLAMMASDASGMPETISPSGVVDIGFSVVQKAIEQSSTWSPIMSALAILIAIATLMILAMVAVNLLIMMINGWILAYAGIFILGFGGSKWTTDMAIGYFRTILNFALQYMTMILIIGIGQQFVFDAFNNIQDSNFMNSSIILVCSLTLYRICDKVPPIIGSLAGGNAGQSPSTSFGGSMAMAMAATAATAAGISSILSNIKEKLDGNNSDNNEIKSVESAANIGGGDMSSSYASNSRDQDANSEFFSSISKE